MHRRLRRIFKLPYGDTQGLALSKVLGPSDSEQAFWDRKLKRALTTSPNRPFQDYRAMPKKKKQVERKAQKVMVIQNQPPLMQASVCGAHTFRFTNSVGSTRYSVSVQDLLGVCGSMGVITNTSVNTFCSSIKVNSVKIWVSAAAGADVSPRVDWAIALNNTPDDEKLSSVIGGYAPGVFVAKPPKKSLAGLWWNSTAAAAELFKISTPQNSIVDVSLSFRLSNEINFLNIAATTVVLGNIYYGYLDGNGSHAYTPVGLPSTF